MLDFAHLILICQAVYYYLMRNWGNEAALAATITELDLHLVLLSIVTTICQGFFLYWVWKFSNGNKLLLGILLAVCLSTVVLDTVMSAQTISNKSIATILSHAFRGSSPRLNSVKWDDDISMILFVPQLTATSLALNKTVDEMLDVAHEPWFGNLVVIKTDERGMSHRDCAPADLGSANNCVMCINFLLTRIIQYTVATGLATCLFALGCLIAIRPSTLHEDNRT
ncbi:hypothetical protein FB451DRAFT_1387370 [Mycena latifolia]|nr:hypothetical protein FB451DRAFT_1387370 [Mycena latifolia]